MNTRVSSDRYLCENNRRLNEEFGKKTYDVCDTMDHTSPRNGRQNMKSSRNSFLHSNIIFRGLTASLCEYTRPNGVMCVCVCGTPSKQETCDYD